MRRLGRRTGWLGWVVAGVLLVSAGGAALAAQAATSTTQAPGASADKAKARAGALGRGGGWRHALGRRVLHGEVTVQTKEGVKTLVLASGQVTALSKGAITVKSSDGVETSFSINGDTRFGFRNEPAPSAELKVGEDAFVAGDRSGDRATAKRIMSGNLARRGAGKATPSIDDASPAAVHLTAGADPGLSCDSCWTPSGLTPSSSPGPRFSDRCGLGRRRQSQQPDPPAMVAACD